MLSSRPSLHVLPAESADSGILGVLRHVRIVLDVVDHLLLFLSRSHRFTRGVFRAVFGVRLTTLTARPEQ